MKKLSALLLTGVMLSSASAFAVGCLDGHNHETLSAAEECNNKVSKIDVKGQKGPKPPQGSKPNN